MLKKYLTLGLICLLLITANSTLVSAQVQTDAAKIKAQIAKRGTGENKRVEVRKLDGTKLKGYISQAGADSFTLTESSTNQNTTIAYSDVAQVKNKLSRGDKIAIGIVGGAAAVAAIVLGSFLFKRCRNEGGC